jgi:hypothetical protein
MSVRAELDAFGKYVVKQSRANLTRKKKKDTGELYKSIDYDLFVSKTEASFSLDIKWVDYAKFIDKGVKGVSSSAKAPNSPYKFGTGSGKKGGLTEGVDKWVTRKRIQFQDRKSGKFMSYKQTAFLIRRSIWFKGIETTNFFTKPLEDAFKRLPDALVEAFGLEVDNILSKKQ